MIFVALGGGLGGLSRVLLSVWLTKWRTAGLTPILWVNWLGSFALGIVLDLQQTVPMSSADHVTTVAWTAFTVGFWGSFTTFSTFSVEALQMLQEHRYRSAAWYIGLSLLGSIGWFVAGASLTDWFQSRS